MFANAIHYHPRLIFGGKARSLPLEQNPVAYYDMATIIALKSFVVQASGVNVLKLFSFSLGLSKTKLECLSLESFEASLTFVNETNVCLGGASRGAPLFQYNAI